MLKIDWEALRREWEAVPHGGKRAFIEEKAKLYRTSYSSIYRGLAAKRNGGRKKKEVNRDLQIEQNLIDEIAKLKMRGEELSLTPRELSTENCIKILQMEGVEGADNLKVSTVNARLRSAGFRMPNPVIRFEAMYANQEHQMDFSRSKYFQIWKYDDGAGDWVLRRTGKNLEYKEGGKKFRTWIVSLADSFSRIRIARAYPATNESAFLGLEFLHWLWNRENDDIPLRYLPEILKTDNGAFAKRTEVKAAFEALGVELRTSTPGKKDSQGKIERPFRSLWQGFELLLGVKMDKAQQETIYMREYNDLLLEHCAKEQRMNHPVRSLHIREDMYRQSILQHPPTAFDGDVLDHAFRVEERQVGRDLMVKFKGDQYEAPLFCLGKKIRVYKNMNGELMGDLIEEYRKDPFVLKPFQYRDYDDFEHRPHGTYRQQIEKDLREEKAAQVKETHTPAAVKSGKKRQRQFFPPAEKQAQASSVFSEKQRVDCFANKLDAMAYISERLPGDFKYEDFQFVFDDLLESTMEKKAVDAVLLAVQQQLGNNSHLKLTHGG